MLSILSIISYIIEIKITLRKDIKYIIKISRFLDIILNDIKYFIVLLTR